MLASCDNPHTQESNYSHLVTMWPHCPEPGDTVSPGGPDRGAQHQRGWGQRGPHPGDEAFGRDPGGGALSHMQAPDRGRGGPQAWLVAETPVRQLRPCPQGWPSMARWDRCTYTPPGQTSKRGPEG